MTNKLNRRDFLRNTTAVAASGLYHNSTIEADPSLHPQRLLLYVVVSYLY